MKLNFGKPYSYRRFLVFVWPAVAGALTAANTGDIWFGLLAAALCVALILLFPEVRTC